MDERKIDVAPPQTPQLLKPSAQESQFRSVDGADIRIDGSHGIASARPGESSPAPSPPISSSAPRANSQLLLDAGRLVQQMQAQAAELEQREVVLQQRLAELEAEQRHFHSQCDRQLDEIEQQRLRIKADEEALFDRMKAAEGLLRRVDAERLSIERERIDVEHRRAALREDVLSELQHERQAIEAERGELAAELEQARALTASLEEQHRAATAEAERLIQSERERLWQTLIAEWEDRRNQFQREHDQWLATSQAERLEIDREKAFYEAAVRNAEADFAAAREAQAAELHSAREQHLATLQTERDEHLTAIQQGRDEHLSAIRQEREEHLARMLDERTEWEQMRAAGQAELLATREQQLASLHAERDEWERTHSMQQAELHSERSILESRIRFQQEHLEKLRTELERSQNEHRHERQLERQRLEDAAQQLLRRMRQIDLYRAAVEEREKSLERERDILVRSRRALSSTNDLDRLSLHAEKEAWAQERQIQQAELRRQQDLLTSHSENLESRRIRLDKLRAELEDTHRSTLEMRLAVEETWVELTQAAGQEDARQRVEQVRHTLVGYYRQLHEGLVEQRHEHLEAQSKFERLRAEFLDERQKLTEWIAARDEELRVGEERLRIAAAESLVRDTAWQGARDRWLLEKAEAEQVIRKLLIDLGNQHRDPAANETLIERMSAGSASMDRSTVLNDAVPQAAIESTAQALLREDR